MRGGCASYLAASVANDRHLQDISKYSSRICWLWQRLANAAISEAMTLHSAELSMVTNNMSGTSNILLSVRLSGVRSK